MTNEMKKKPDRRETYDKKMKRLGFKKLQPYVHEDDREKVLAYTSKLMNDRMNKLD